MAVLISTQLVDVPIFFPIFYSVDGCPHLYHLFQLVDVPIFSCPHLFNLVRATHA